MKTTALIAAIVVFPLLAACTPSENSDAQNEEEEQSSEEPKSIEEMREEALAAIDQEACAQAGGEVRQEGMLGLPRCVIPYEDAGKVCSDGSDCEGRCLASDDVSDYEAEPGEIQGRCEADDSPFGCYAEIHDGTLEGMICVD
jgi:hypothetical protein